MEIDVTALTKIYRGGVRALADLNLHITPGMHGLLGANGAGKTTLLRILVGILPATSGQVLVGGHDMADPAGRLAVKRALGYLPQELGVYPDLSAARFLDYIALLKGIERRAERRRRVAETLELVGLTSVAGRKLKTYSGGMRQRVGIAAALLNEPRLLVVDEPTAGLDPQERVRFRTMLAGLAGTRTVLLSTHIVDDVAQTCQRLTVLAGGRAVFTGSTDQLAAIAQGRVWSLVTRGPEPATGSIAGVWHVDGAVHYRVVADVPPAPDAEPAPPTLEDGYLALMAGQESRC